MQRNLILSHCCGVGEGISNPMARFILSLKFLSLGRGASGVRWDIIELILNMLPKRVTLVIFAQISVGASGNLAPLAQMSGVLIGEGEVDFQGKTMSGAKALQMVGLHPLTLGPKEGLALINGTQFSTASALAGLFDAWDLAQSALIVSTMSIDAIMGSTAPSP